MPNPLEGFGGSPPAPNPDAGSGAMRPYNNALMQQASSQSQPQQPAPPPAPTHAQTVSVLRHTTAIAKELRGLLALPELGKSNTKSQIVDGTTGLVADRILTPAQAVSLLSTVPSDPLMQRKWAQAQFASNMAAMNNVLDHHAMAFPGTGDLATEMQRSQSDHENHFNDVTAALAHYPKASRNA
jgi:hypothetical protein